MKKLHIWQVGTVISFILTIWYIIALITDLTGNNYLNPTKHLNTYEFVWALIFLTLTVFLSYQARKLRPQKK